VPRGRVVEQDPSVSVAHQDGDAELGHQDRQAVPLPLQIGAGLGDPGVDIGLLKLIALGQPVHRGGQLAQRGRTVFGQAQGRIHGGDHRGVRGELHRQGDVPVPEPGDAQAAEHGDHHPAPEHQGRLITQHGDDRDALRRFDRGEHQEQDDGEAARQDQAERQDGQRQPQPPEHRGVPSSLWTVSTKSRVENGLVT
jgi:hypothetical protein